MMHLVAAIVSMIAVLLYAQRSGKLAGVGAIDGRWAVFIRVAIGLWMASNVAGFLNLYDRMDPFEPRHVFVLAAMAAVVFGHLIILVLHPDGLGPKGLLVPAQGIIDIIEAADHASHGLAPCTHPGCIEGRERLRELAKLPCKHESVAPEPEVV
jgi:hypothetical protein